ncbi:prostate-associated microseminoprotein [Elgaria multicarinata webbii]|uniref:prostate-associated microseminoprotein n=1 Tax=Elgaria multicarinata webbii TaxID=159646 RepID=UPI002FCD47F7
MAARAPVRTCLFLALLVQLPGTLAICYFHAQAPCLYKGKPIAPGESWQDVNCSKCFCLHPLGVGCCDTMQPPADFPDGCEVHYDSRACKVSLVQKAQPGLPCQNHLERSWGSGHPPEPPGKQGPKTWLGR